MAELKEDYIPVKVEAYKVLVKANQVTRLYEKLFKADDSFQEMYFGYEDSDILNLPMLAQQRYPEEIKMQGLTNHPCFTMDICNNNMEEKKQRNDTSSIGQFMASMDDDCKHNLAKYLSTGNFEELHFRREFMDQYFSVACILGLKDMKTYCEERLKDELVPSDSLQMLQVARAYGMEQLQDLCLRFIEIHFPKLWQTAEFQYLGQNDLISLLQNPVINTLPCIQEAIKYWYDYEQETRQEGYYKMRNILRKSNSNVKSNISDCANGLEYVIMFTNAKYDSDIPKAIVMRLDTGKSEVAKLGKIGHCGTEFAICSEQKDVTEAPYIYVSGGKEKSSKRVFKCDVIMNKWREYGHLKRGRSHHCMVNVKGRLIVLGGRNDVDCKNEPTIEECKDGKHFKIVSHLCESVRSPAYTVYKDKVYIFGGIMDNAEHSLAIQIFDPASYETRRIGRLPCRIGNGSAVVLNGKIYINSECGKILIFDPETGDICACIGHPRQVRNFGIFCNNSDIYIAGGIDENGKVLNDIYKYSTSENKWEHLKSTLPLPMPIYGCCKIQMQKDLAMVPLVD